MKKLKILSVFLLLICIINILFPQQIFAAKTKYVLVAEEGDWEAFSPEECFSPDDKDLNFLRELHAGSPYKYKCTYNNKGQLTKAVMHQRIGIKRLENVNTMTYTYDKKGRLIKKISNDSYNKGKTIVKSIYTYTYNKKNQLIQINISDMDSSKIYMTYKYKYYSNGNINSCTKKHLQSGATKKWTFNSNGIIKSFTIDVEDRKVESVKYDSHGNIKESVEYNEYGEIKDTYKNVYNNDIIEKSIVTSYESYSNNTNKYEIIYYTDGVLKGEIKEEQWYNNDGVKFPSIFYEYKLDSSGKNIVQKQKYSFGRNGEKILEYTTNYKWKKINIK